MLPAGDCRRKARRAPPVPVGTVAAAAVPSSPGRGAGQRQLRRARCGRAAARSGQPVQLAETCGGQDDHVSLQSEQLNKYAETVESTAESADSPYTRTLGQVFNDGDWLRISLMLTSEDDSLAGFNAIGPREDARKGTGRTAAGSTARWCWITALN